MPPLVHCFLGLSPAAHRLSADLSDAGVCSKSLLNVTGKDHGKNTVKLHHQESVSSIKVQHDFTKSETNFS